MLRRWPELRAGLIAVAIALGLVDGCPIPPPHETLAWHRGVVEAIRPVQRAVLAPVRAVPRALRLHQRWALMQVGATRVFRLTVEARPPGGAWAVLFRAGDPAHAAYAELLEHDRVFGAWNPTTRLPGQQPAFARWFARRVLAERADLEAVRISYEDVAVGGGRLTGSGRLQWATVHTREAP